MQKTYLSGLKFADRLLIGICRVKRYVFVASNVIEPRVGKDFLKGSQCKSRYVRSR